MCLPLFLVRGVVMVGGEWGGGFTVCFLYDIGGGGGGGYGTYNMYEGFYFLFISFDL